MLRPANPQQLRYSAMSDPVDSPSQPHGLAVRALLALRDGWLIAGVMLALLVLLEVAYRAQSGVRAAVRGQASVPPTSPYADSTWYPDYLREYEATFLMRWKPFVYFRRAPFTGRFINVDEEGIRSTPHVQPDASDTVRIMFFGGSTMWGSNLRDSATIPAVVAQRLAEIGRPNVTFSLLNLGESGYVLTQEMIELQLRLRAGEVPDIVLFYDGINDVAAAVQRGEAGVPQNELNRAREFDLGRALFGSETGVGSEARAATAIAGAALQRLQLLQRLRSLVARPALKDANTDALASSVANSYAQTISMIEALRSAYRFEAVYVWQPTLHNTPKVLTTDEKRLLGVLDASAFDAALRDVHRRMGPLLDSAMTPRSGVRFVNLANAFVGDTSSIFVDHVGHNTEKAIPKIVDGFLPALVTAIDSALAHRRRGAGEGDSLPNGN